MSVASSFGLPQPPVAVQAASIATSANTYEPYDGTVRIPFWNGVASEVVFEKDIAVKGRVFGAQVGGLLTFGPTPTQAAGVETTYSVGRTPTLTDAADFIGFECGQPQYVPVVAGSPGPANAYATPFELNYKRSCLGGNGVVAINSMPILRVRSVFNSGGTNTTVPAGQNTFSAPVCEFSSVYQAGIIQVPAGGAPNTATVSVSQTVPGLNQTEGIVQITQLGPGAASPYVTMAQGSFTVNIPATAGVTNPAVNFAWFVVRLNNVNP